MSTNLKCCYQCFPCVPHGFSAALVQNTWHASTCIWCPATPCQWMPPEYLDLESRALYIMYCNVFTTLTEFSALIEAYIVENKDLLSSHHRSSAFLILSACCIQRFAFNRWQDCPKKLSSDFWLGVWTESRAASEVIFSILLPFGSVFLPSALLTTENHKIKISGNSENCWTLCALQCQIFSATI